MLQIYDLSVNHWKNRKHPEVIALDESVLSFAWKLRSDHKDVVQTAWHVTVRDESGRQVWNSGVVESDESTGIVCGYRDWTSRERYIWNVEVYDNKGESALSECQCFEMSFMDPTKDWNASWVEPDCLPQLPINPYIDRDAAVEALIAGTLSPEGCADIYIGGLDVQSVGAEGINLDNTVPPYDPAKGSHMTDSHSFSPDYPYHPALRVRRTVWLETVENTRLYMTVHGVYKLWVNGEPVTVCGFDPDFSNYNITLQYQVYCLDNYLKPGKNVLSFLIGDGWYKGKIIGSKGNDYGDNHGLLYSLFAGEMEILSDGGEMYSYDGAIRYSDFFRGEEYDSRWEDEWRAVDFDDSGWKKMHTVSYTKKNLAVQMAEPVRVIDELPAKDVRRLSDGRYVVDFGRNVAGHVRLKHICGEPGHRLTIAHYEMLNMDGTLPAPADMSRRFGDHIPEDYIDTHEALDHFICNGKLCESYTASFTYHAFRYAVISGYPGIPTVENFSAVVIGSDLEQTGSFVCSDERLNRLQSNIWWSQLGNLISIPTDCPVRERAGWTGDVWVYGETAAYLQNVYNFFRRYLKLCRDDQKENGEILNVVPRLLGYGMVESHPNAGWADIIVKLPYVLYQIYGDKQILEENYEAMVKWLDWEKETAAAWFPRGRGLVSRQRLEDNAYLWNSGFHVGDHLIPVFKPYFDPEADEYKRYVASAMYSYSVGLFSEIAHILGKEDAAVKYSQLKERIKLAMRREYMDENGDYSMELQAAYVLALGLDLMPGELHRHLLEKLIGITYDHDKRMETGFLSVPYLLEVLSANGYTELALDLLYQTKAPSWLYEVLHDATTMWETWTEVNEDGKVSFGSKNHYAFGAVGTWMYQNMGGVRPLAPGFKKMEIAPLFNCRLSHAEFNYETPYGRVMSAWKIYGSRFTLEVQVPENTSAVVKLNDVGNITVDGNIVDDGMAGTKAENGQTADNHLAAVNLNGELLELGSGRYIICGVLGE